MSNYSEHNEVIGTTALTGALIVASVVILLAFLGSTLPQVGGAPQLTHAQTPSMVDTNASQVGRES